MGIQFHLFNLDSRDKSIKGSLYPPDQLINTYDQLAKTGLPLHITEITVPGSGENGSILQANIVENLYRLWFSIPNMEAITWWNLADGTAHENENNIQAGLLDNKMDPKPAYLVLDKLINQEWKTNMTIKTNTKGRDSFRGFFGKYRINYNGKKYEKEIELTKSSDNKYIIQL
jgi:GH35 family endo-1,4-beta-xylanase